MKIEALYVFLNIETRSRKYCCRGKVLHILIVCLLILRPILAVVYATGRGSHARPVEGDDPDKKRYPGPPGWGLDVGLTKPTQ